MIRGSLGSVSEGAAPVRRTGVREKARWEAQLPLREEAASEVVPVEPTPLFGAAEHE